MGVDVFVYDDTMTPLTSASIEIIEVDHGGTKIDLQASVKLGPAEYGAKLTTPSPLRPVNVVVDDTHYKLAATMLGFLNAKVHTRLDVTLYPLPVGSFVGIGAGTPGPAPTGGGSPGPAPAGGGGGAFTPDQIASYVQYQVISGRWSEKEATGVLKLAETVFWALSRSHLLDADLKTRLHRWLDILLFLGIQIAATRSGWWSQGGSAPLQVETQKPKYFQAGGG